MPAHRPGWISRPRTPAPRSPPCRATIRCWPTDWLAPSCDWALRTCSGSSASSSFAASSHASADVSRLIVCNRMPNRILRPRASANARTRPIFSATASGGSPQVRYTSACRAATGSAASEEPPK